MNKDGQGSRRAAFSLRTSVRSDFPSVTRRVVSVLFVVLLLALVALRLGWFAGSAERGMVERVVSPVVMGTTCRLIAVGHADPVEAALAAALSELEQVEALMSTYDPDSELSRFNTARSGSDVPLSPPTLRVMQSALELSATTGGAFDVTVVPLTKLWANAAQQDELPSPDKRQAAVESVGYQNLELGAEGASKRIDSLEVSLDALAKGFAIDQALGAMANYGLRGALVDVGGDLACFGRPLDQSHWRIAVQSPWEPTTLAILQADPTGPAWAVCTSGNYQRYFQIQGRRYSHLIDPRTGWPAEHAPSVTVVGPAAMLADGWATALSILSVEEGQRLISEASGLEALWVQGDRQKSQLTYSSGFRQFIAARPTTNPRSAQPRQ